MGAFGKIIMPSLRKPQSIRSSLEVRDAVEPLQATERFLSMSSNQG
jgi:hypothetical protein